VDGETVDLLVVGGGINGAGIARDAAGQGLSVVLVERRDLASATSSASSKLIHGGLRYLEYGEFRLVRESLREREVLLRLAPHLVWPLRFVLPHEASLRPAWMIRLGLFLYDNLGGRETLPRSRGLDLAAAAEGRPLKPRFRRGFEYSDCWCDDARLVVANCLDAAARGASIRPRTELMGARRVDGVWEARLDGEAGPATLRARAIVNAAGPWAGGLDRRIEARPGGAKSKKLKLVKGSHIVVDRVHEGAQAYIFQNDDKRVIFLLPFLERYSLIGTTDIPYDGDPAEAAIDAAETDYLIAAVNRCLRQPIARDAVRWAYAGVRPLYDDGAVSATAATRDYVFDLDAPAGDTAEKAAPLLTIFGGKLTTYRKLAEHAMAKLLPALGRTPRAWTATAPLAGGDMAGADFAGFAAALSREHAALPPPLMRRYARLYGTRARLLLEGVKGEADLGEDFGAGLRAREIDFLRRTEWAAAADDILWRRTKLGLDMAPDARRRLEDHLARKP
jgi:glycerol-3-phosphate dehydrogenase